MVSVIFVHDCGYLGVRALHSVLWVDIHVNVHERLVRFVDDQNWELDAGTLSILVEPVIHLNKSSDCVINSEQRRVDRAAEGELGVGLMCKNAEAMSVVHALQVFASEGGPRIAEIVNVLECVLLVGDPAEKFEFKGVHFPVVL